jgi:hypothetical protein
MTPQARHVQASSKRRRKHLLHEVTPELVVHLQINRWHVQPLVELWHQELTFRGIERGNKGCKSVRFEAEILEACSPTLVVLICGWETWLEIQKACSGVWWGA